MMQDKNVVNGGSKVFLVAGVAAAIGGAVAYGVVRYNKSSRTAQSRAMTAESAAAVEATAEPEITVLREPSPAPGAMPKLLFIFEAGGKRWLVLDRANRSESRDDAKLLSDQATIMAPLGKKDVPAWVETLSQEGVMVEGKCKASLGQFALMQRESYTLGGVSAKELQERLKTNPVIAAELQGCKGSWAHPANSPVGEVKPVHDKALEGKVKNEFFASQTFLQPAKDWTRKSLRDSIKLDVRLFEANNGDRWMTFHAYAGEHCDQQSFRRWALYQVQGHDLTYVHGETYDTDAIVTPIDLDADGKLEWIIKDWDGQLSVRDGSGNVLHRDDSNPSHEDC